MCQQAHSSGCVARFRERSVEKGCSLGTELGGRGACAVLSVGRFFSFSDASE